jgi:hypothetical protein
MPGVRGRAPCPIASALTHRMGAQGGEVLAWGMNSTGALGTGDQRCVARACGHGRAGSAVCSSHWVPKMLATDIPTGHVLLYPTPSQGGTSSLLARGGAADLPAVPFPIKQPVIEVACGRFHTLFLTEDTSVWACGARGSAAALADCTRAFAARQAPAPWASWDTCPSRPATPSSPSLAAPRSVMLRGRGGAGVRSLTTTNDPRRVRRRSPRAPAASARSAVRRMRVIASCADAGIACLPQACPCRASAPVATSPSPSRRATCSTPGAATCARPSVVPTPAARLTGRATRAQREGQLGFGDTKDRWQPEQVPLPNVKDVAPADTHTLALTGDGKGASPSRARARLRARAGLTGPGVRQSSPGARTSAASWARATRERRRAAHRCHDARSRRAAHRKDSPSPVLVVRIRWSCGLGLRGYRRSAAARKLPRCLRRRRELLRAPSGPWSVAALRTVQGWWHFCLTGGMVRAEYNARVAAAVKALSREVEGEDVSRAG